MTNAPETVIAATQVEAYSPTVAALADLRARFAGIVYDVAEPGEMKAAREARAEVKSYRVALEKKRVEIKAPALAFSKLIDTEAARITAELSAIEDPIDAQIKAHEQAIEDRKAAAAKAEAERVAGICKKLYWIRDRPADMIGKTSEEITLAIGALNVIPIDADHFGEFAPHAFAMVEAARAKLYGMVESARANEAEAASLATARADLKRREDAVAAIEAAAKAKRDKEDADAKAERDRLAKIDAEAAAERKRILDAQQKEIDEAERARLALRLSEFDNGARFGDASKQADEAAARDPWAALARIAEIADDPGKSDSIARGEMYDEALRVASAAGVRIIEE